MDQCLSKESIAECVGISPRMVSMRANKEAWPIVRRRVRGGYQFLYPASSLPDDVRAKIYSDSSECGAAGFSCGILVNAERLAARQAGLAAYNSLSDDRKAEADARHALLQARDAFLTATRMPKKKGTLLYIKELKAGTVKLPDDVMRAIPRRKGKIALSWATIYRWEKAYQENGRAGLAGQYVSKQATSIPDHMQRFIQAMLTDHPHVSIPDLRLSIQARFDGQTIPSDSSLRRFTAKWKSENKSLTLFLRNPDEWKNKHMFAFGNASEQVERLNQVWEFDSTPADVMLTDGRHTLIGVIDIYSRRAGLLVSPTSKAESVAALTRKAMIDWGIPENAKTDNGSDYVSKHMVRVFTDLEINQILCPPFTPESKPHIERFFHTFSHSIVELLPGYIGHNVADRKAIEARRTFAQRMMKQGADPITINLSSDELQTICDRWISAIYHQNQHSGLGGKTPSQVAREWALPVRRIENLRALDILLCQAPDNDGRRTIGKNGIQVENASFIGTELAGHEGETVRVLLDRTDFGAIYVFSLEGEFICRAINPDRTGHDRAEIAAEAKAVQKRVIREAAAAAKKLAREAKTRFINDEILRYRESQIANVVDMPKPSQPYTTPMLDEAARAVEDVRQREFGPTPIGISDQEERQASAVIELAEKKVRAMGNMLPWERYEYLTDEMNAGKDLEDTDLAWMKRYEHYMETGKKETLGF